MAKIKISGETPFQVLAHSFSVSPSTSGYLLQYSANGEQFTSYSKETPANENLIVNGIGKFMYFKLSGNTDTVDIQY